MEFKLSKLSAQLSFLTLLTLIAFSSSARVQEPVPEYENHLSIGPSLTYSSAPFEGLDGYYTALPTFSFRWGNFFGYNNHDEPLIGFELFQHKRIMFGLAATSGRTHLNLADVTADKDFLYWGIDEDRERAYEAGFIFRFFSRVGLLEIKAFHDVVSTYSGPRSTISWSRPFPDTGNWSIVPRMFIKHYGHKFNAYYYQVTEEENDIADEIAVNEGWNDQRFATGEYARTTRPQYTPGNSGHVGVDLTVQYDFNESLSATGYLVVEKFSGEIETSPLINDKELILANIGIRYNF